MVLIRYSLMLAAYPFAVLACILSYLCILVTLHNKDVFPWRLVYDFLQLITEVFNVIIIIVSCLGISMDNNNNNNNNNNNKSNLYSAIRH